MRWRFADHLAWQKLGEEAVVIDLRSGTALGLNGSATLVWTLLEDHDDEEIGAVLANRFALDEARALGDVRDLTSELGRRGLLLERS